MKGIRWAAGALALTVLVPAAARAQGYDGYYGRDGYYGHDGYGHDGYGRDGYGFRNGNTYGIGYQRGFRDGAGHGAKDARNHESFNYAHDGRYRRGDSGYRWQYGPRHEYVAGYQNGFRNGYQSAYRRYGYPYGYDRGYDRRYDDRYDDRYRDREIWETPRY